MLVISGNVPNIRLITEIESLSYNIATHYSATDLGLCIYTQHSLLLLLAYYQAKNIVVLDCVSNFNVGLSN